MPIHTIKYKSANIRYKTDGQGKAVVLLHGYLESLEIWDSFATELSKTHLVISMDLHGHGESETIQNEASVEIMAEGVKAVLDYLKIEKVVMIGHSMGGYAVLAFAELWPGLLLGFGLFHSISWGDLPEKKIARDREIELIKEGKKQLIVNVNIPRGFADDNLEKFKTEVDRAIAIASKTTDDGVIAALNALKSRPDRTHILEKAEVPVYFAVGMKDNYIPVEKLLNLSKLPKNKQITVFENSGHMAFIEEQAYALDEIEVFLRTCFS